MRSGSDEGRSPFRDLVPALGSTGSKGGFVSVFYFLRPISAISPLFIYAQ